MSNLARPYSDKYLAGQGDFDLFKNKNTDWTTGPFLKVFYVALIVIVWGMLHVTEVVAPEDTWTVTNMIHGVVSTIRLFVAFVPYLSLVDHIRGAALGQGMPG